VRLPTDRSIDGDPLTSARESRPTLHGDVVRRVRATDVALYLNRRQLPFTALNSSIGALPTGFDSWTELHLNRRQPRVRGRSVNGRITASRANVSAESPLEADCDRELKATK
jgi:hypothetical protein